MDEYISREDALLHSEIIRVYSKDYGSIDVVPVEYLADIPSADVQPVKHGYWEEVTDYGGWGDTHYRCSVCGEEWYLEDGTPKQNNMDFCPRCGARMEGDAECY